MPKLSDIHLTDKYLKALKPRQNRYDVFDAVTRSLGIRVSSAGTKSWFVMKRINGRMRRVTLGRYPDMTLAEARLEAVGTLKAMTKGKYKKPDKQSFEAVFESWFKDDQIGNRSAGDVRRAMEIHVLPAFKNRLITDITEEDIEDVVDKVVDGGAPVQANRVLAYLRCMFKWCVKRKQGILDHSPVAGIDPPTEEQSRDRVLSLNELFAIWVAAESKDIGYPFGPMFQLLMLTGQRRIEVAAAEWSEFDLDDTLWTLPAARAKNGDEHLVHLAPQAIDILNALPRIAESSYLFTTTGTSPVSGFSKAKKRLDEMSGVEGWTIHDLRRSFATHITERLGVMPEVADKILNHSSGTVKGSGRVYQRGKYLDQRRRAMTTWANFLLKEDNAKVVRIA